MKRFTAMKPFVRGDLEGFFVLANSVLIDLILMNVLLVGFLGFSEDLFYYRVLPAAAVGLIIGNGFYAYQALKLAEEEGRDDVTAMPFGTSVIVSIVFVYLVMYPVQQQALADGLPKAQADIVAWHAGVMACIGSGLIEFFGAFFAKRLQDIVPRPALLVAIGGTGLTFISLDYFFRIYAFPVIGFSTLALVILLFIGGRQLKGMLPGGLLILSSGIAIAWTLKFAGGPELVPAATVNLDYVGLNLPLPVVHEVVASWKYLIEYLPIIVPIGFIFLIGSLQNIEGAAAAGDRYRPRPLLITNGLGTLGTAFFGSPFPVTIYLGQVGYKRIGARAGYSTLNAIVWTVVCFTGTLTFAAYVVPIEAGMALIIFVGIVVCAQSFEASDVKYAPAIVFGLIPALAAYVTLILKHGMAVIGTTADVDPYGPDITEHFAALRNFHADGLFALGQGYLFTSMILACIVIYIIDRKFRVAAYWTLSAAVLSAFGVIHDYAIRSGDIAGDVHIPFPEWNKWVTGYLIMAVIIWLAGYFTEDQPDFLTEAELAERGESAPMPVPGSEPEAQPGATGDARD